MKKNIHFYLFWFWKNHDTHNFKKNIYILYVFIVLFFVFNVSLMYCFGFQKKSFLDSFIFANRTYFVKILQDIIYILCLETT